MARDMSYLKDMPIAILGCGGVAFKPSAGILNPDTACSVIEKELDTMIAL